MYYRLYDKQCKRYMATGYNAKSKQELVDDYKDYINMDIDENEEVEIANLSLKDSISMIIGNDFFIDKSKTKFDENECD